ncbi:MAG: PEP-CTERM sorting domain-containing protein [Luteolibacter sp.]
MKINRLFAATAATFIGFGSLVEVANASSMIVYGRFMREGTTNGLGGVIQNIVSFRWNYEASAPATRVERPTGSSTWSGPFFDRLSETTGGITGPQMPYNTTNGEPTGPPFADVAAAAAWQDENMIGTWTVDYGDSSYQFDTTSVYQSVLDLTFMELTAASAQQFLDIREQGLTGNFTFQLTSLSPDPNNTRYQLQSGSDYYNDVMTLSNSTGYYFELNIINPLTSDATLDLWVGNPGGYADFNYPFKAETSQESITHYGLTVVPEPSSAVLALLGTAAFFRRRR